MCGLCDTVGSLSVLYSSDNYIIMIIYEGGREGGGR